VISGGTDNQIQTNSFESFIGSGFHNSIEANAEDAVLVGGDQNHVAGNWAFVGGGNNNQALANFTTIGGGFQNTANGTHEFIGGGSNNTISASTTASSILGGGKNFIGAGSAFATVAGGSGNTVVGTGSFAAGQNCSVQHAGSFMWSDGTLAFGTVAANTFNALATGGYYLFTGSGVGVQVASGGNAWSQISDRNAKENFRTVDCQDVLEKVVAMPLTTWNLKTQSPEIRHIGVMAQDFHAAFQVGENERCINTVDADGVALAAIQGLNEKLEEELKRRDVENAELKSRLAVLEKLVAKLSEKGN